MSLATDKNIQKLYLPIILKKFHMNPSRYLGLLHPENVITQYQSKPTPRLVATQKYYNTISIQAETGLLLPKNVITQYQSKPKQA